MQQQTEPAVFTRRQFGSPFRLLARVIALALAVLYIVALTLFHTRNILEWSAVLLPFVWFPSLFVAVRQLVKLVRRYPTVRFSVVLLDRIAFYTIIAQASFLIALASVTIVRVLNEAPLKPFAQQIPDVMTYSLWVLCALVGMSGSLILAWKASQQVGGSRLLGGVCAVLGLAFVYGVGTILTSLQGDLIQQFSLPITFLVTLLFHLVLSTLIMERLFGKKVKNREFLLSNSG